MLEPETYTGGIVETNGHLLHLPGGKVVLVDAPAGVVAWLEKKGVEVDALLLTHQHFDHVQEAAEVKEKHGCPVYAWSDFSRELTLERLFGAVTGMSFSVPAYEVDHVLEGQEEILIGGLIWKLLHIPGHSADSVCFWNAEEQILLDGDVLMRGGMGRCDFPGGSFEQLMSGIREKLCTLPEETRVFPGHGPATTVGMERRDNPYLQ